MLDAAPRSAHDADGTFGYRILAKRKDIAGERLATYTVAPAIKMPQPLAVPDANEPAMPPIRPDVAPTTAAAPTSTPRRT